MQNENGQSMVETLLILPAFLILFVSLISICEFTLSYMWVDYQLYRAALCLDSSNKTYCLSAFMLNTNSHLYNMYAGSLPGDFIVTENEIHVKTKLVFNTGFISSLKNLNFFSFDFFQFLGPYKIEKKYFYPIMRNI